MKLVVGLGNPGKKYESTRHNAGAILIDSFAQELGIHLNKKKFESLLGEIPGSSKEKTILLKPQTFMNLSGRAVLAVKNFYKISILDIIVLHDDIDLTLGTIRFREKGSSGGHNGLNSIIETLGMNNFARIKIGIGRPLDKNQVTSYVLEKFTAQEKKALMDSLPRGTELINKWLGG